MYIRLIDIYRDMKRTIRLKESELRNMITESVRRVLREGNEIEIAPGNDGIIITDTSITTDWGGGITYEVGREVMNSLRNTYQENHLKSIMNQAIAFSSKPWQLERILNNYFGIEGKIM